MTLSALIKKGGLLCPATATLATYATDGGETRENCPSVATVATVAVAAPPELPLDEEQRIRAWLDYIEEDDRDAIAEVLEKCRRDRDARRYFLERAEEVPSCVATVATVAVAAPRWVTCGDCAHYRRTDHPHLGHCAAGEPENVAGLWDSDRRVCGRYKE